VEPIGENRAENAREKDVEEIEERTDARDRDDRTVRGRDRQPIELLTDRSARGGLDYTRRLETH